MLFVAKTKNSLLSIFASFNSQLGKSKLFIMTRSSRQWWIRCNELSFFLVFCNVQNHCVSGRHDLVTKTWMHTLFQMHATISKSSYFVQDSNTAVQDEWEFAQQACLNLEHCVFQEVHAVHMQCFWAMAFWASVCSKGHLHTPEPCMYHT